MAVSDDLNRLTGIVYLSRSYNAGGVSSRTELFQGRLRETRNFNWIFDASAGQNGVLAIDLGVVTENWSSAESATSGIQVIINNVVVSGNPALIEMITLTTGIPENFVIIETTS